jgi:hypothetical protein
VDAIERQYCWCNVTRAASPIIPEFVHKLGNTDQKYKYEQYEKTAEVGAQL